MILDSGSRTQFYDKDGNELAVRDVQEGKGRCDLMPLWVIGETFNNDIFRNIGDFVYYGNPDDIMEACRLFVTEYYDSIPDALLEVAIHYEEGSRKYQPRNWERGIPWSRFVDSGTRHLLKVMRGDTDEDHKRAFLWNMFGLLWTIENKPELNDLPSKDVATRFVENFI